MAKPHEIVCFSFVSNKVEVWGRFGGVCGVKRKETVNDKKLFRSDFACLLDWCQENGSKVVLKGYLQGKCQKPYKV
jgi:hypothetical protein